MMRLKEIDEIVENKNTSASGSEFDFKKMLTATEEKDSSVTNGASIAFIIEYREKKLLFLADAHSDIINNNLTNLIKIESYPNHFDVIKVAHHGSRKNTTKDIMNLIKGKNFLISTNGLRHKHPELETLVKIINAKTDFRRKIIFNYPNEILKFIDDHILKDEYNYSLDISDGLKVKSICLQGNDKNDKH